MENPRITSEEIALIKDAQAGNESAFNKLFEKYKNFVFAVLNQFLDDEDESKDLVNIVFLKVHNKLSTFKAYDSFGGWLRIISNRTAIDYLRRMKNRSNVIDEESIRLIQDSSIDNTGDGVVDHLLYEQLLTEIEKLSDHIKEDTAKLQDKYAKAELLIDYLDDRCEREVLQLIYVNGCSRREIEAKLGYSRAQIYRIQRKALKNILRKMKLSTKDDTR